MAFAQNDADVEQDGDDNEATVQQVYQSGWTSGINQADVVQDGNGNKVKRLRQVGASNTFSVTQDGDNNVVQSHPEQGVGNFASWNGSINITQNNDGNEVWDADQAGYGNSLTITQDGNDKANVEAQVSYGETEATNSITITQMSGANTVGISTHPGSGAYQEGYNNTMDITQSGGASAGTVDKMVSEVNSTFFRGSAEGGQGLIQAGGNNTMTIDQDGASTVEFILQDGYTNTASVTQSGLGNTAQVTQMGNGNSATINQSAGGFAQ
jgi:hypothetical protein